MDDFCTYIFKKGKKKGIRCKEHLYLNHNFCKKHILSNKKDRKNNNSSSDTLSSFNMSSPIIDTSTDAIDTNTLPNNTSLHRSRGIPIIQVYKKLQEDSIKNKI